MYLTKAEKQRLLWAIPLLLLVPAVVFVLAYAYVAFSWSSFERKTFRKTYDPDKDLRLLAVLFNASALQHITVESADVALPHREFETGSAKYVVNLTTSTQAIFRPEDGWYETEGSDSRTGWIQTLLPEQPFRTKSFEKHVLVTHWWKPDPGNRPADAEATRYSLGQYDMHAVAVCDAMTSRPTHAAIDADSYLLTDRAQAFSSGNSYRKGP